jgi:hypothetical protein
MEPAAPLNDTCSHQGPTAPDMVTCACEWRLIFGLRDYRFTRMSASLHVDGSDSCEANLRRVCSLAVGTGPVTVHTVAFVSCHVHFPTSLGTSSHRPPRFHVTTSLTWSHFLLTSIPHCIQLVIPSSRQCSSTALSTLPAMVPQPSTKTCHAP